MDEIPSADIQTPPPESGEPITSRLMARLFIVPLLIVVMIIGSSVLVVFLFGWISTSQQESVEKLMARIEAGSGEKVFGVALLPKDKEVWQAAMELARRLEPGHPQAVSDEQKPGIARRLEALLAQTRGAEQHREGQEMQQFLLAALGNLGQAGSVDLLIKYATDAKQPLGTRRAAFGGLVMMRNLPATQEAIAPLISLLEDPQPVVRIEAVVTIGALAQTGDASAVTALTRAYRTNDREVAWNAALALAKLGSGAALPLLKDMLTRDYWKGQKVDFPGSQRPNQPDRLLTPTQVEEYLIVALDAAAALRDKDVQPYVQRLAEDSSLRVRDRARKAMQAWSTASATSRAP